MAPKPHDKLIHCDACGEDYSATYRRCPFCGERSTPRKAAPAAAPAPQDRGTDDLDDGYVFDGQDAFDDEPEQDYAPARPKGGKRLAPKQGGRSMDLPPINWPRLITFLCSLVIIVAALIIVFTFIYPQLHGDSKPKTSDPLTVPSGTVSQDPGPGVSTDVGQASDPVDPASQPPVGSSPVTGPTATGITIKSAYGRQVSDITLWRGQSTQLSAAVTPSGWSGQVVWTSSNPEWLTVSSTGFVTNVNTSGAYHNAYITASADGVSVQCVVRVQSRESATASQPPASNPPSSQPPASNPPSGGTVTVGQTGTIVGATGGLNVRSGPGTTYARVASLVNGNTVRVLEAAGDGWYKISFAGERGAATEGYIMGRYISTN